ncbi:MAG: hypothetical protein P8020_21800 [Acidobacteriota bacterium]
MSKAKSEVPYGTLDLLILKTLETMGTNRKVKFYTLTPSGRRQIGLEVKKWEQANALVTRFLEVEP